jgi:hypothetical protein
MELKLYDTYERRLRPFETLEPGRAGRYACGPTRMRIPARTTAGFKVCDTGAGSIAAPIDTPPA